jgi:hypothetical protein
MGWGAEKVGRLKPNGRFLAYTPLARVIELETLAAGVTSTRALWRTLGMVSLEEAPAQSLLDELISATDEQLAEIERLHALAAEVAFQEAPAHA